MLDHMRPLDQVVDENDPGFPLLKELIGQSSIPCEILAPSQKKASVLLGLQVTTRSMLGTIAYETGGVLIDSGWLRLIGSGSEALQRDVLSWNEARSSGFLLVADDAVGGFFAINGGGIGEDVGSMYFWAPDTLEWEALGMGHSSFIGWALSGSLSQFYSSLRWDGWESEVKELSGDQCFNFYPFLWTKEGSVNQSHRKAVPVFEQYAFNVSAVEQINGKTI